MYKVCPFCHKRPIPERHFSRKTCGDEECMKAHNRKRNGEWYKKKAIELKKWREKMDKQIKERIKTLPE